MSLTATYFLDFIAFGISCLLILLYYLYLDWRNRRHPDFTVHATNAKVRQRWVNMIMTSDNKDVLAVQTLRNSVMASNFMASTAVLLIIGILNLSEHIDRLAAAWQPFVATGEEPPQYLHLVKLGLLLLDFFIAFYCFSMAIRFFNHVGYMINLPADPAMEGFTTKHIGAYLNRAGTYYTFGTRAFFFSLPLVLWFFGPYPLILATLVLIASLYSLDRAPSAN
ncbi:MAG: DUF599 domain-containing protein [Gammaproteobacteria bacterium]